MTICKNTNDGRNWTNWTNPLTAYCSKCCKTTLPHHPLWAPPFTYLVPATPMNYSTRKVRTVLEHSYFSHVHLAQTSTESKRCLSPWLISSADQPHASREVYKAAPDKVFMYACAVLNDGLILLELRDAIHEGDGPRIIWCWKFLLLYFRITGHTRYA